MIVNHFLAVRNLNYVMTGVMLNLEFAFEPGGLLLLSRFREQIFVSIGVSSALAVATLPLDERSGYFVCSVALIVSRNPGYALPQTRASVGIMMCAHRH